MGLPFLSSCSDTRATGGCPGEVWRDLNGAPARGRGVGRRLPPTQAHPAPKTPNANPTPLKNLTLALTPPKNLVLHFNNGLISKPMNHKAGPTKIKKATGSHRRGMADGPRETRHPTPNAEKPKRRTNKNATADGKNDAERDRNYRGETIENQHRTPQKAPRSKKRPQLDQNTIRNRQYATHASRAPILGGCDPQASSASRGGVCQNSLNTEILPRTHLPLRMRIDSRRGRRIFRKSRRPAIADHLP